MDPTRSPLADPASLPLRDIHLPPAPAWWPPAPGWWILAALAVGLPLLVLAWRHLQRRGALRRAALAECSALRQHLDDPPRLAAEVSLLLRRVSLALDPGRQHAALTGEAWLARLRQLAPGFEDPVLASLLLTAPYAAQPRYDGAALLAALERWLRALPARPPHSPRLPADV